ncbi:MAG: hypothetical protein PHD43_06975 [Methylococcales bacterium]|nr:hypothetical protein [Methylococcales bacterium]
MNITAVGQIQLISAIHFLPELQGGGQQFSSGFFNPANDEKAINIFEQLTEIQRYPIDGLRKARNDQNR